MQNSSTPTWRWKPPKAHGAFCATLRRRQCGPNCKDDVFLAQITRLRWGFQCGKFPGRGTEQVKTGQVNPDHLSGYKRRTNVQQLTCNIDLSSSFYYLFFSFVLIELKPFVLKGEVLGENSEKVWKSAKKCENYETILLFSCCPLVFPWGYCHGHFHGHLRGMFCGESLKGCKQGSSKLVGHSRGCTRGFWITRGHTRGATFRFHLLRGGQTCNN